tara:strand:+ start:424 stop:690 length:267 start_codon:yes stop_codon:yes gene_type:complete
MERPVKFESFGLLEMYRDYTNQDIYTHFQHEVFINEETFLKDLFKYKFAIGQDIMFGEHEYKLIPSDNDTWTMEYRYRRCIETTCHYI